MMICWKISIILITLAFCLSAFAGDESFNPDAKRREIDSLLESAISRGLIAGGVVVIGNSRKDLFCRAYGRLSDAPDARPVVTDTIFDIASLTKVVATAPAVLKLVEEKKVSLLDPVSKWFPEFHGKEKDDLLIMHLLTHTSGLDDFPVPPVNPLQRAIEHVAAMKSVRKPGYHFKYADINFILLGELVRRVTGEGVDRYAAENIFSPLRMNDTGFNPRLEAAVRCAATLNSDSSVLVGLVQDDSARLLGGVAGHAGLFSTAPDLSRFCRMVLNGGTLDRRRVLSERTIDQMTVPYFSHDSKVFRGLGWDISSPYSSPRGNGFSEISFGHTGYSGSSIWIDPEAKLYVVLITARLDYKRIREFNKLRSDLSSITAALFSRQHEIKELARKVE
jgi:CubicO group peptidase (beta-lactamase class C family)